MSEQVITCPVDDCDWTLNATPPAGQELLASAALVDLFGLDALISGAQVRHGVSVERQLQEHYNDDHEVVDYLRTIARLRQEWQRAEDLVEELRKHLEARDRTIDRLRSAVGLRTNEVSAGKPPRCPSCEHRITMHDIDGCEQEIGHGPDDEPCCCPCQVTDGQAHLDQAEAVSDGQ